MSPLQLVSSGLMAASERSDGVGDTGGLELVLPKRMTRPGTGPWANENEGTLVKPSPTGWCALGVAAAWWVSGCAGCDWPFFRAAAAAAVAAAVAAAAPPFCSW